MYDINKSYLLTASLNGKIIYQRTFKGYLSAKGLTLAINDYINNDFKNFDCTVTEI